jgi:site-specific DNA recombinase
MALPHPAAGKGGSYVRLSELPPDRDPLSPDNQRRINLEGARRDGVELVKEYLDLGITAAKDIRRPAYEEGIDDLLHQGIQSLYVTTVDRFSRRGMGQVGNVLDDLERVGGRIVFEKEGLDSSKPNSRLAIAIHSEIARAEADAISWRMTEFHGASRRKGLWAARRPFGYLVEDHKLRPHPTEAPIARRVIDEFLDGATYRSIAQRLNADGIPSPWAFIRAEAEANGRRLKPMRIDNKWSHSSVTQLLHNPSLAALVSHKGQLVYNDEGAPISCGEGIVTMGERARILAESERRSTVVRQAMDSTRVGKRTGGGRPAKYLLTGFGRCGYCHSHMQRTVSRRRGYDWHQYRCSGKVFGKGCPGGSIGAETLEAEVVTRLTKRLATCEPGDPLLAVIAKRWMAQAVPESEADRRRLEDALAVVKQTLADLYDDRYERHLFHTSEDIAEWEQRIDKARSQRAAIQKALDSLGQRPEIDINALLDTELSREAWPETPLARKRDILKLAVNAVLVTGARRGQRSIEDRVTIAWAHEELPELQPPDEAPPVNARELIARLVAEERAGVRPRVTTKEAVAFVGIIRDDWARVLLREERAKQAGDESP